MDVLNVLEKQIQQLQSDIEAENDFEKKIQFHTHLTRCTELYAKMNGYFR